MKHSNLLVYIEFQSYKDNNGDQREPARPAGHSIDKRLHKGITNESLSSFSNTPNLTVVPVK